MKRTYQNLALIPIMLAAFSLLVLAAGTVVAEDQTQKSETTDVSLYQWGYWDKGVLPAAGPRFRGVPTVKNANPNYRNLPPAAAVTVQAPAVSQPVQADRPKPKIKLRGPRPHKKGRIRRGHRGGEA